MELGTPELLLAAITVISPIFSAIAIQSKWDSKVKNAAAFGVSLVLSVVYLFLTNGFADPTDIPAVILATYGLQQIVYKTFMEKISKKVEAATSVHPGEAVIVETGKENEVIETGRDQAEVIMVEEDATPVEPGYEPAHRGDTNPVG